MIRTAIAAASVTLLAGCTSSHAAPRAGTVEPSTPAGVARMIGCTGYLAVPPEDRLDVQQIDAGTCTLRGRHILLVRYTSHAAARAELENDEDNGVSTTWYGNVLAVDGDS